MLPGGKVIDGFLLYKPLFDPRDGVDFKTGKLRVEASLNAEGIGIYCKEPALPYYVTDDVQGVQELERQEGMCPVTVREHFILATAHHTDLRQQNKLTLIKFPKGMNCNKEKWSTSLNHKASHLFNNRSCWKTEFAISHLFGLFFGNLPWMGRCESCRRTLQTQTKICWKML